jgi:hypothetical protein
MPQIFHPSTNTISKVSIFGGVFILAGLAYIASVVYASPYYTQANVVRDQPVQFSHKHHVDGLGIDCRYCHTTVEESAFAGIPATETCMSCHSQIWTNAPALEPVRSSYRTGESIPWVRVHDLPDFVQFNHSIHVAKGIGCVSCHGRVDQMPLTWQEHTLFMQWCLDCHRNPEVHVRPRDRVFDMAWERPDDPEYGRELLKAHRIQNKTACSYCHY